MVNNGYPYKDKKLIKLVAIVLVCVAICFTAGIITILYLQQHTSRPNTGSDTNASSDTNSRPWSTKDEFYQKMRGIKIGTARDIVERSIGKPDLCSRKIYRGEYELQHCGYDLAVRLIYHLFAEHYETTIHCYQIKFYLRAWLYQVQYSKDCQFVSACRLKFRSQV